MKNGQLLQKGGLRQYVLSIGLVALVSLAGGWVSDLAGYRVVAFMLLATVSLLAMFLDIVPVLLAAAVSALTWNFFFIPPRFTFHIGSAEDILLFLMYFLISLINAVLTFKIRQVEKQAREKEEKEKTIRLYNTLLNSLSHELRTPIAALIGASDNLLAGNQQLTEKDKRELAAEISSASLRLNQQVENLLNMSRLESGSIMPKKDWCEIGEIVGAAVRKTENNLGGHPVRIDIAENLPLFRLDFGLTVEVLVNLLNNAAFYTPPGTPVTIVARCDEDETLDLVVFDEGPGFPKGETEKVFGKFYRLSDTRPGGTGLGLSIVKGFVEAQGGSVTLENLATGGACFRMRIPAETSYLNALKNE